MVLGTIKTLIEMTAKTHAARAAMVGVQGAELFLYLPSDETP
jgi:hypothetical protein